MIFDREFTLSTGVWEDELAVIFTSNIKASITKRYRKYKIKDPVPNCDYAAAYFLNIRDAGTDKRCGWLMFDMKHIDPLIIAHECLHATSNILRHRGLYLNEDAEETYTYTQQYLSKQVGVFYKSALKKYKARGKKN